MASALMIVRTVLASRPCHFTLGEITPGTHCIGGWVDPRAGLYDMEKLNS
jgi:hypothetical protein